MAERVEWNLKERLVTASAFYTHQIDIGSYDIGRDTHEIEYKKHNAFIVK